MYTVYRITPQEYKQGVQGVSKQPSSRFNVVPGPSFYRLYRFKSEEKMSCTGPAPTALSMHRMFQVFFRNERVLVKK